MDKVGVVEMFLLGFLLVDLWKEFGCYEVYGDNLFKLKDCWECDFILGLIYEEMVIFILCDVIYFYKKLLLVVY